MSYLDDLIDSVPDSGGGTVVADAPATQPTQPTQQRSRLDDLIDSVPAPTPATQVQPEFTTRPVYRPSNIPIIGNALDSVDRIANPGPVFGPPTRAQARVPTEPLDPWGRIDPTYDNSRRKAALIADYIDANYNSLSIADRRAAFVEIAKAQGLPLENLTAAPQGDAYGLTAADNALIASERAQGYDPRKTIKQFPGRAESDYYDQLHPEDAAPPDTKGVTQMEAAYGMQHPQPAPSFQLTDMTLQQQQDWIDHAEARKAKQAESDQSYALWKSRGSPTGWTGAAKDVGYDLQGVGVRAGQAAGRFQGALENTLATVASALPGPDNSQQFHRDAEEINNWWDDQAAKHPISSTTLRIAADGIPVALKMGGAIAAGPAGPLIFAIDGMGQFQAQAQGPLRKMVEDGRITQAQMDDRMAVGGGKAAAVSAFTYYLLPQLPPIAGKGAKEIAVKVGMQAWEMFAAGVKQSVIEQTAHAAIANEQYGAPLPHLEDIVRESLVSGGVAAILHTVHAIGDPHMEVRDLAKRLGLNEGALPMLSKIQAVQNAVDSGKLTEAAGMHALAMELQPSDLPHLQQAVVGTTAAVRDQYKLPPEAAPMIGKVQAYTESVKDGSMSQPEALAKLNDSLTPQDLPYLQKMVDAHQFPDDGLRTVVPEDWNSRLLGNPPGARQTVQSPTPQPVAEPPTENAHVPSDIHPPAGLPPDPGGQDRPNQAPIARPGVPDDGGGQNPVGPRTGRTVEEAHAELHGEVTGHYPDSTVSKTPKGWLIEHPDGATTPIEFDAEAVRKATANPLTRLASIVGRFPGEQIQRADGTMLTIPDRVSDLSKADRQELLTNPRIGFGGAVKGGKIVLDPEIAGSRVLAEEVYHEKMRRIRASDPDAYNELIKPFRDGRSQLEAEEAAFGKVNPDPRLSGGPIQATGLDAPQGTIQKSMGDSPVRSIPGKSRLRAPRTRVEILDQVFKVLNGDEIDGPKRHRLEAIASNLMNDDEKGFDDLPGMLQKEVASLPKIEDPAPPSAPENVAQRRPAVAAAPGQTGDISGFTTSKGSTYTWDGSSSQRTKSLHDLHDPKDVGLKKRSLKTVFIDPPMATEIGMWNTQSNGGRRIIVRNGRITLVSKASAKGPYGKDQIASDATYSTVPAVGKAPLELWGATNDLGENVYASNHPGNPITALHGAETEKRNVGPPSAPTSTGDVNGLDARLDSKIPYVQGSNKEPGGNSHSGSTIQQSMQDSFTRGIPDYQGWTQFNKPLARDLGSEGPALWERAKERANEPQPASDPGGRTGTPDWVKQEMQDQGKNPDRILNDVDMGRPKIKEQLKNDPITQWIRKNQPELLDDALKGNLPGNEVRRITQAINDAKNTSKTPQARTDTTTPDVRQLFQGRGATPAEIYGQAAVDAGHAVPVLGKGDYYATTEEDAKNYGQVSAHDVDLSGKKMLTLQSDADWRNLMKQAGATHLDSRGIKYHQEPSGIAPATERVKAYLLGQGYDGVEVKLQGDEAKALRETFGHDQIVLYSKTPASNAAATPAITPEAGGFTDEHRALARKYGDIHPKSVKGVMDAIQGRDVPRLQALLHPDNNNLRRLFADQAGRKLPPTVKGTNAMIETWAAKPESTTTAPASNATIRKEQPHGITQSGGAGTTEHVDNGGARSPEVAGSGSGQVVSDTVRGDGGGRADVSGHTGISGVGNGGRKPESGGVPDLETTDGAGAPADTGSGETPGKRSGVPDGGNGTARVESKGDNHIIGPDDVIAPKSDSAKFAANVKAVKILHQLEQEHRQASPDEKRALAQYTGWGWAGERFNPNKPEYAKEHGILKELLTDEEFRAARASTLNAHYTSPDVIRPMWELARRLGFKGGKVLEPAVGAGHFFGMMPTDLANNSSLTGIDLDKLSSMVASALYPQADIQNRGFETARIPNNSQALNISNVPFGSFKLANAKDYPNDLIHDYFFKRGLDKLAPGQVQIFITSDGTMDKGPTRVRAELAEKADFVGGIRLPNNAFKGNAGTEVTTDILVFRKKDGGSFRGEPFLNLADAGEATYEGKDPKTGIRGPVTKMMRVNEYWIAHPENVLGEHTLAGTMYSAGDYAAVARRGQDTAALLREAISRFPENITGKEIAPVNTEQAGAESNETEKELGYVTREGQIYQVQNGKLVAPDWLTEKGTGTDPEAKVTPAVAAMRAVIAREWVKLKSATTTLFAAENRSGVTDADLVPMRKELNRVYDAYVKRYGPLNKRMEHTEKARFMADDPEYPLLQGLESVKESIDTRTGEETMTTAKGDIFRKRLRTPRQMPTRADNVDDAMSISLGYQNALDPDLIAKLTGITPGQAVKKIVESGRGFENPHTGMIETRETYLSGNVRRKLKEALEAAKDEPKFKANADALEAVQPPWLPLAKIKYQLSGRWLPDPVIQQFARDVLKFPGTVQYVPQANGYSIGAGRRSSPEITTTFGTTDLDAIALMQHALNGTTPTVTRTTKGSDGQKITVVDQVATQTARDKMDELKREFVSWTKSSTATLQHDGEEKSIPRIVEDEFNAVNNAMVPPVYDGSHLKLPGLTGVTLKPHQLAMVARGLAERQMVVAHGVGSGKTYELIVLAHELKRLGLAKKNLIVVQKATLGQFTASIRRIYPDARVLVASEKSFYKNKRRKFMAQASMGDWDMIVVSQPSFERIHNNPQTVIEYFNRQTDQLEAAIRESDDAVTTKQLEKAKKALEAKLTKIRDGLDRRADKTLFFEHMGIDSLLIDEAHAYKRIPIITRKVGVKGIPNSNSDKAMGTELKAMHVQGKNAGKGVILATGTPITNTTAEAYVMMKLAAPNILKEYHIETFDDFANTFGETHTDMEYGWGGKWKMQTRFNRFTNPKALVNMIRSAFDVKIGNRELGLTVPSIRGGGPAVVIAPQNAATEKVNRWVMAIADTFEGMTGMERRENNWVPIVTMGSGMAGALDPRLIDPSLPDLPDSKINLAAGKIVEIYHRTTKEVPGETVERGVQLVFADRFKPVNTDKLKAFVGGKASDLEQTVDEAQLVPDEEDDEEEGPNSKAGRAEDEAFKAGGFNLYHDLRDKLIQAGIPAHEIAIIHEHNTDARREKLFAQVNAGHVRVMIGSTEKMGVGVNAQVRAVALHQLDPPRMLTPAMMEQRVGRAERQGNLNAVLDLINYGTEKSMDTGIYQMLENKGKAAVQLLKGHASEEDFEDPFDDVTMSMAEMKGKLTGDDRAIQREALKARIAVLERRQNAVENERANRTMQLDEVQRTITGLTKRDIPAAIETEKEMRAAFGGDEWNTDLTGEKVGGDRKVVTAALQKLYDRMEGEARKDQKDHIGRTDTKTYIGSPAPVKGKVNGVSITLGGSTGQNKDGDYTGMLHVRDKDGDLVRFTEVRGGTGILSSLKSLPEGAAKSIERLKNQLKEAEARIPSLEKASGVQWDKQDELDKLRSEKREIDASLLDDAPKTGTPLNIRFRNTRLGYIQLPEIQGVQEFGTHLLDSARRFGGSMFPTAHRASPNVADRLAEYVSSRIYAREASQVVADWILTGDASMPASEWYPLDKLVGAVLTQDNLDSLRDKSDEPDEVHTLIGADNSPFATEEEYEAARNDPRVLDAIDRYKEWFAGEPEANYRMSQGVDPNEKLPPRGKEFAARVNLKAIDPEADDQEGKPVAPVIANKGNLRNPRKTPSPFARKAGGKGQAYETSLEALVANTLTRGTEPANLARVYKAMKTGGLAVEGKPGRHPTLGGKATVAWDMKNRTVIVPGRNPSTDEDGTETDDGTPTKTFGQNKVLYIRVDMIPELRRATNVDDPIHSRLVRGAASLANKAALASLSEAMFHLGNQVSALATTPGAGFVIPNMVKKAIGLIRNDPETRRQLVELAKIGGVREHQEPGSKYNPLSWIGRAIGFSDRVGRLVLDDAFKHLVKKKLIANTDANRRDLANKFGQYNKRAQHWLVWMARETGLGPFATAGTNFYTQGIKTAVLNPGVAGVDKAAALQLKGMMLGRYALAIALVGLANWLRWKRMDGSAKTPLGSIRVANDADGNEVHFDVLDLIGLKRGLRSLGVLPAIEAKRKGGTNAEAMDAGVKEAMSSVIRPFEGPIVRFLKVLKTGSDLEGRQVAHKAEPGRSQSWEDTKAAFKSANPLVDTMTSDKTLSNQWGKFWLKSGGRDESRAEVLARRLARDQAGEHPYTESQLEKATERREMVKAMRHAGTDAEKDKVMEKAIKSGMTGAEAIKMRKESEKGVLMGEINRLTPDNLMRVWDASTDAEKDSIREFAFSKIQASHLSHEAKERFIDRITGTTAGTAK